MALMHALIFLTHELTCELTHHHIAEVVGGLHREVDWNDDRRTRGCVARP